MAPQDDRIVELRAVHFVDRDRGWIAGRGGEELFGDRTFRWSLVLSTADGGASWSVTPFAFETTAIESSLDDEPTVLEGF